MSVEANRMVIDMTPTPNVLESGDSHFSRVSDALCEFIDNSIQATQDPSLCPSRDVDVHIIDDKDHGYAIIRDNGCGMTREQLEIFARYSYSKELRNGNGSTDRAETSSVSNISKYGVGAKQAGFFLGHRLHVVTKTAESSSVLEFMMCPAEMKERFRNNQDNVFEGTAFTRSVEDIFPCSHPYRQVYSLTMCENIASLQQKLEHFTLVIIHLHAQKRSNIRHNIPKELSDVYFFHMHPRELPQSENDRIPVVLRYFHNFDEYTCRGRISEYFESKKDFRCFHVEIPEPQNFAVNDQTYNKVHMHVKLLYFPYKDGEFTHPGWNSEESRDEHIFSVFWQGRLVPETTVKTLKGILPDATTLRQCTDKNVPYNWQRRLKGFLFLDDTFKNISNNKLKITVHPSFNDWLEFNYQRFIKDRWIRHRISTWINEASLLHDREYCFINRLGTTVRNGEQRTVFSTMYSMNHVDIKLFRGTKIQWKAKKSRKIFKVFAEVEGFYITDPAAASEQTYAGTGVIMFKRLPTEVYGDEIHEAQPNDIAAEKKLMLNDVCMFFLDTDKRNTVPDEVSAGRKIPFVVVVLKDGYGNIITEHASSNNAILTLNSRSVGKYSVSLILKDSLGNIVKDMGRHENMAEFGLKKAFWFANVSCTKAGTYYLAVIVYSFKREFMSWSKKLQIVTSVAARMSCECAAKKDVSPLDELLLPILVRFHDQYGNDVAVPSDLDASDFTIEMDHEITHKYAINVVADPGDISHESGVVTLTKWRLQVDPIDVENPHEIKEPEFPLRCSLLVTCRKLPDYEGAVCKIKVGPAKPARIAIDNLPAMPIEIRNGDMLPELYVTCRDNRGYRAQSDDSWEVVLVGNAFVSHRKKMRNGVCTFSNANFVLDDNDIPPEGLMIEQRVVIENCPYNCDSAMITLKVLPSMRIKGKVGQIINKLTLHFFTRSNEEWAEYDHVLDCRVNWNDSSPKSNKDRKCKTSSYDFSPELLPIKLPNEVPEEGYIEYEVTCKVFDVLRKKAVKLEPVCFTVQIESGDAVAWFLNTTSDSIISGDQDDFARVVKEVYAVDEFNNRVQSQLAYTPVLTVRFDHGTGVAYDPISIPLFPSSDRRTYVPVRHSRVTSPVEFTCHHSHMPARICVTGSLRDCSVPINIVGGEPVRMKLVSTAHEYDGNVPVFHLDPSAPLADLEFVLLDSSGGAANMRNVSNVSLLVNSEACGEIRLYEKCDISPEQIIVIKSFRTKNILENLCSRYENDVVVAMNCLCTLKLKSGASQQLKTVFGLKRRNFIARLVVSESPSMNWKEVIGKPVMDHQELYFFESKVSFNVHIVTEDRRRCNITDENIDYSIVGTKGEGQWLKCCIDGNHDTIHFFGTKGLLLEGQHKMTLKVTHPECPENEMTQIIFLNGVSGRPAKLKLHDPITSKIIHKTTTTVLEHVRLHVVDENDQRAGFKNNMIVTAAIKSEGNSIVLLKNLEKGCVRGRIDKNEAIFDSISISHEWPEIGTYKVVFDVKNARTIAPVEIEIIVVDDQNEAERRNLEVRIQKYLDKRETISAKIKEYTNAASEILSNASSDILDCIRNVSEGYSQQAVEKLIKDLCEKHEHMCNPTIEGDQNIVGNLLYVKNDETLAKILSWASNGRFSSHLVDTVRSARAVALLNERKRIWQRTSAINDRNIDLPDLRGRGHPKYLAREICFFRKEHKSLTRNIFGAAILVDNVEFAFNYITRGVDIYTRDGYRVSKVSEVELIPENQQIQCRLIKEAPEAHVSAIFKDIQILRDACAKLDLRSEAEKQRSDVDELLEELQSELQKLNTLNQMASNLDDHSTLPRKRQRFH